MTSYYDKDQYKNNNQLPTSKQDINLNRIDISTESNGNTTNFTQGNTSSFNLNTDENYLFGNDFMVYEKPKKLGKLRNYLYINKYPLISIGENITYPLLFIFIICFIYIIFY